MHFAPSCIILDKLTYLEAKILCWIFRRRMCFCPFVFFFFYLHSPAGLIGSDLRKQSIKNVVLVLIFSQISCGQLHSAVFSGERCLVAHTLFIEEKSVMSPSAEALWGRQMEVEWPRSSRSPGGGRALNLSWWDLQGLNTLCALAGAWAAFVFPIKCLKQWMIAVGNCVQYKYRIAWACVCVITVRSLLVIIHDIPLLHKLHIRAQLKISGFKRVDVRYIQH